LLFVGKFIYLSLWLTLFFCTRHRTRSLERFESRGKGSREAFAVDSLE